MCTSKIIILALASILENVSSNVPLNHQTLAWSALQQRTASTILPEGNTGTTKFQKTPKKFIRKVNLTNDHHRRKKNHFRPDPMEDKKLRLSKALKYSRNPNKNYPADSEDSDLPSSYLIPPKITNTDYRYYENRKKALKYQDAINNRSNDYPKNHRFENDIIPNEKNYDNDGPAYVRDHAPEQQVEATDDRENNEHEERSVEQTTNLPKSSKDRIEFHIQGHAGPDTYVFGFDTGAGENRQYRMEERHEDGTVTGYYGYVDARGKLRKVRYKASPAHGYEEKHHETKGQEI